MSGMHVAVGTFEALVGLLSKAPTKVQVEPPDREYGLESQVATLEFPEGQLVIHMTRPLSLDGAEPVEEGVEIHFFPKGSEPLTGFVCEMAEDWSYRNRL